MNKILYKITDGKASFWLMRDAPKEPGCKMSDLDANAHPEIGEQLHYEWSCYTRNLKKCKANALEIINPELLKTFDVNRVAFFLSVCLWSQIENSLKHGDIFPLPSSLEFEELLRCGHDDQLYWGCTHSKCNCEKVIRLIPKQKEETQDGLFDELFCRYFDILKDGKSMHEAVNELKSKFTIQRNKS